MSESFVGEIRMFAGNFAPQGWAFCNGQLMAISQNDALFSLIGTIYGGDGRTTFGLPDFRGRVPVHTGQGPGLANYPMGMKSGVETVTLITPQLPQHTHTALASNNGVSDNPSNNYWANTTTGKAYTAPPPAVQMNPGTIGQTGGTMPHSNMIPYLVVSYIICLYGIYPSRN